MRHTQTLMFLLVVANGFFADVAYGAQDSRWNLPISPVLILIVAVAARTIYLSTPAVGPASVVALALLALGTLIPSSSAAWTVLFAVSALGIVFDTTRRAAHHLPLALAVTQMWKAVGFKVLASPVVDAEAVILGAVLRLIGFDADVVGNVIRTTPEHSLILLAGCSALSDLGVILLGWTAVFMLVRPGVQVPVSRLAIVAGATIVFNILRLVLMAINQEWYDLVHNGMGASIYDAVLCALVMTAGLYHPETDGEALRVPPKTATFLDGPLSGSVKKIIRYARSVNGRRALACAVVLLATSSLGLKWLRYSEDDISGRAEAQVRLKVSIAAAGFTYVSSVPLTADGAIEGLMFEKAGCEKPLFVSLLGASGGTELVLSRYLNGAPIALVLDGQIVERWPMLHFVAANAVGVAKQLLRGDRALLHPLVSVSPTPASSPGHGCSWPHQVAADRAKPAAG
jgi:hypothetical protein